MKMNKDIQKHESKQGTIDNCVMNLINGSFNVQKTSDSSSSIKEYSDSMISTEFLEVNEYQHRYDCDRLAEFIDRTASILHNRLQPGFANSSKGDSHLFLISVQSTLYLSGERSLNIPCSLMLKYY
jgi:predicted secreted Zn-dependent protease